MKQLLFFCALVLSGFSVWAQTNTWTGAVNQNWNSAGNWSLGIPTDAHDVVIPTGSTVNVNIAALINSIVVEGTSTLNISNPIDFFAASSFSSGTTANWSSGSLTGSGTLTNNGTINLLTANNKSITSGKILNNEGTINIAGTGDLYITDGVVNNQLSGVIDMQTDAGNLSYSSSAPHILNNFGLIKRTTSTGAAIIECDLVNSGTLSVESGTMNLSNANIALNGGIYNVFAGCVLGWNSTLTVTGTLTGLNNGEIAWAGTITVPPASATQWNFTGTGHINWSSGTLNGGGTATNNSVIDLSSANNKSISGATVFNNTGTINIIASGDLYLTDAIVNNQPAGVIDLKADSGYLSYSSSGSHILNNYGLIKRTTTTGLAVIECELHNEGTVWVQSGTLNFNNAAIALTGGTYNVNAGTFLTWNSTVSLSGTLTGTVPGEIVWYDTVQVAAAQTATLAFTGSGNINWSSGSILGGGTLNHQFRMRLTTANNKSVNGGTTFNNSALIYNQSSGDLYLTDGIFNNLAGGTIDLRADNGNLSYSSSASHVLNNFGLIKKTTSAGEVYIESDLNNTGTISVESGTLILGDNEIQLNGGTYNVAAGTIFQWQNVVTCSGTLNGVVDGQVLWTGTATVPVAATINFTGSGAIQWNSGALNGGGALTNNFVLDLDTANNKSVSGLTTFNNAGTVAFVGTGDLYITDGIVNNQPNGVIDLRLNAAYLSYSTSGSHTLNNFGLIKKTGETGVTNIECLVNNSGTVDAQVGTINLTGDHLFTNNADGVLAGTGTIDLPPLANFTNNGTLSPGGSPGTLTVIGPFESETGAKIAVELNGLTPVTQHDVLAITGNAAVNGSVDVVLGFAAALNDSFTVATTTGTISVCGLAATTSAIRNDLEYTFSVGCVDDNKVVLTVIQIVAVPPIASAQTFCVGATVADLEATGTGIQWYAAAIGGSALAPATLLATGTYYATQTVDGFESDRVAVSITINTTPQPTAAAQVFTEVATVADLVATGTLIQWYANEVGGTALGNTVVVETGTYYVSQTLNSCESTRLAVSVTVDLENFLFYVDADGDGFGTGNLVEVEEGPAPPAGYSTNNTDCDDADENVWQSAGLFMDNDGDGYDVGTQTVCYGAAIPNGYSETTTGTDCDDNDNTAFQSNELFVDADGDGYDVGTATVCYGAAIPTGYSETTTGTDCDDSNSAVNPGATEIAGNNTDDNCNGATDEGGNITTTLTAASCGATLASLNSLVGIISLQGATAYRIRATNVATSAQQTIVRSLPYFSMPMFAGYDYAATYAIDIEVQMGGVFVGYYGPACNISTPAILVPGGAAQVTPSQCGITLANVNTLIATTSLAGVTGYRFRVTNLTDNTAPNQVQTIDRTLHWFSLPMLATFTYGTTYRVEVAMKTNGNYTAFGNPCTVTTPAVPALAQCGGTIATANTLVATTSLPNATQYRFELTNTATSQPTTVQTPLNRFTFGQFAGYAPGQTYQVRVAVMTSGVWSLLGGVCTITAPGVLVAKSVAAHADAKVWPNPFTQDFTVAVDSGTVKKILVYDMLGRLVEQQQIEGSAESFKLGGQYPSGVYNLIVTDESATQTIRIIKR